MKILFIGDIFGSPGRDMVKQYLPKLKTKYNPHFIIINGENAAHGKGITQKIYNEFINFGANVITMGNHTWGNREIFEFIDGADKLIRPANFPEDNPGKGITYSKVNGKEIAVINLQGRAFLPPSDCPFKKADELIKQAEKRGAIIFVDFHAEATSEKQAMGWYLDGRAAAVVGTHTHIQTADNRILPNGTAYITDVGMTGPYDGVLGVDRDLILKRFLTGLPVKHDVAQGREQLSAVIIEIDDKTRLAKKIDRILINEDHHFFE
ncbi:TIGR00282 family metallophosphoesterase [Metabacillus fastidiosus]|uniref:TIGR00282 family metallophosphoesterase n=1 Tax=Metabacillus fastidiosus TaxID=1458 RepID=UPI003D2A271A